MEYSHQDETPRTLNVFSRCGYKKPTLKCSRRLVAYRTRIATTGAELNPKNVEPRHKVRVWAGQFCTAATLQKSHTSTHVLPRGTRALTSHDTPCGASGTLGTTRRGWRSCLPLWPLSPSLAPSATRHSPSARRR